MRPCFVALCLAFVLATLASATTIHVPQDQSTIQAGIDAATNGDTVLVSPGTYIENLDFKGKAITVTSSSGPQTTVIDGGHLAPVVVFHTLETAASVLSGFTLQNGYAIFNYFYTGGGISIVFCSPTIKHNIITNNDGTSGMGGGIGLQSGGSPTIEGNLISNNSAQFGGGIYMNGGTGSRIVGNMLRENRGLGGGIAFFGSGNVLVQKNIFESNDGSGEGGGLWIVNEADEEIVDNLFFGNTAFSGSQIYTSVPQSTQGFRLVNNTIVSNRPSQDAAVYADGFNANAIIANNLIVTTSSEAGILCNPIYQYGPPIVAFNDVFSASGVSYDGDCSGFAGKRGNISADPQFVNPQKGDFELASGSPAIDAGHNFAQLPKADLAGNPRIVGPRVDMGAYEYQGNGRALERSGGLLAAP